MSFNGTNRRPERQAGQPVARPDAVAENAGNLHPADVAKMLAALPGVETSPTAETREAKPLQSWFEEMLVKLPDGADPDADFELRRDSRIKRSAADQPKNARADELKIDEIPIVPEHAAPVGSRTARMANPGRATSVVSPRAVAGPAPRPPAPPRKEESKGVEASDVEIAGFLSECVRGGRAGSTAVSGKLESNLTPSAGGAANDTQSVRADEELLFRIQREIQKYPVAAAAKVQFAVKEGNVTIIGEVPGDYEKQLIVHFTKSVGGVVSVVDLMRPAGSRTAAASAMGPRPAPRKKSTGSGRTWSLPFKPTYAGIAAGLIAVIWAGYSFGTRDENRMAVHPVSGRVMFAGQAPEGALVVLHPTSPANSSRPRGTVKSDGTYTLMTYAPSDGAPEGDYKLTIVWHKLAEVNGEVTAGPNLLPPALSKPETTTLNVAVMPGKNEVTPIQIQP